MLDLNYPNPKLPGNHKPVPDQQARDGKVNLPAHYRAFVFLLDHGARIFATTVILLILMGYALELPQLVAIGFIPFILALMLVCVVLAVRLVGLLF